MTSKSILLAIADPQALVDVTQALGAEWEVTSAASDSEALARLELQSFDALLVDFNLGDPDASDLLNQASARRPETTQFLVTYEADLALVAAKVQGTPHILPKPIEPASLKARIENAVSDSNSTEPASNAVNTASDSPKIPSIYADVLKAIESPGVTDAEVGDIIAGDTPLTAELLRLTNSSYLGLPRNISDPGQAVESLGLETVKALVMALQFLAEHSRLKPGYLSLDQVWEHSVNVAQIARDLVLFETKDRLLASQALMAGLLHDLGKVVLVMNFDDLYGRVHSLARKQPVALWDIEREMFGANHGEIGACLVGMWNMPAVVVEAAALHHDPPLGEQQQLTPLAAVHIANVLARELCPGDEERMVPPIINTSFLNELGLLQRLPVWRAAFANRRAEDLEPEVDSTELEEFVSTTLSDTSASRTANQLPPPATATRTTTSGQPRPADETPAVPGVRQRTWVYAGVAAVALLVALWLNTQPEINQSEPIYARMPARHEAPPVIAPSVSAPETAPGSPAQVSPAATIAEQPPAPPAPTENVSKPSVSQPAPETNSTIGATATPTNVSPSTAPPPVKAPPEFRLNGIIYSSVRPSAIVNGRTVNVGDQVNGATVVGIGPASVTLSINGQRRTYELQ